jgi:peptidoglycan/xylan/chitin deacetylase (PgdA/CDA1 family)
MALRLPPTCKIAVSLGVDFDAHSVWPGSFGIKTPGYLSRGEFGAEVGAPRLLELFKKYEIRTTWFTPTHTMETFPASFESVMEHGHEIGAHGCLHERIATTRGERRACATRASDRFA